MIALYGLGLMVLTIIVWESLEAAVRTLVRLRRNPLTIRILVAHDGVRTEALTACSSATGTPITDLEARACLGYDLKQYGHFDLHVATWHVVEVEIPRHTIPHVKGSSR